MNNARWGLTIPLEDRPMSGLPLLASELTDLGYTDLWTSEADYADGLTPLAAVAAHAPTAHLGAAILPVQTRGPALLAMSAAALASLAPGRVSIGIGASSPAIVARWNGLKYEQPLAHVRDTLSFLREALTGSRMDRHYDTFHVDGFRLRNVPEIPPRLFIGALRSKMLQLARDQADGAITNWLAASDVARVREELGSDVELVARLMVCPSDDADNVRRHARRLIVAYLTVPAYRSFQEWLGRGDTLAAMWDAWDIGDRRGAMSAIPDEVVDEFIIHGSPDACRSHINDYVKEGVTVPVIFILPFDIDAAAAAKSLAPRPCVV